LLSSFVIQLGTALSKTLFESLGVIGTVFICKAFAAVLLRWVWQPRWQRYRWKDYGLASLLGLSIALMSIAIYSAIDRIPLGIASTLEFVGPLGVAVLGSRRLLDLVWVGLAAIGVFLLAPFHSGTSLDPVGVGLALLSGPCWGGYILLSAQTSRVMPGGTGLAVGVTVATFFLAPIGIAQGGNSLTSPLILGLRLIAAILTTILPYSMEYVALNRMPPRVFGVLMSIEPAIATLVGLIFLGETLDWRSLIAVLLVMTAAIGVTLWGRQASRH
jgi:inner membrane transporter RhtA